MRKTKMEKGITLIALIITIVVLLILAVVAINSIQNEGILSYAQNAATDYNKAVANEQERLNEYLNLLNNGGSGDATTGRWTQTGTTVTDGTTTLTVGDYVNYVSGVSGYTDANGWQVIGAENGQILLMSSNDVVSNYTLEGEENYLNGVAKLNTLCTDYGKGTYATGAKSVNVNDINRVTGYNPSTANYGAGNVYQYGNKVTYTLTDGKVAYASTVKSGTSSYISFTMPDGKVLGTDMNSFELISDCYSYTASSYLKDTSSNAYKLIFGNDNTNYWLASTQKCAEEGYISLGFRVVYQGNVDNQWACVSTDMFELEPQWGSGVRAVIYLEADVKLTPNGANSWKLPE